MNTYNGSVVWIIGASSGIGEALANNLAQQGALLALSARRHDVLDHLKKRLGESHQVFALDVTDADKVQTTAKKIQSHFGRIDRVIFLAAGYEPMALDSLDLAVTQTIVSVNLMGAFNIIHGVIPILKKQPWGQVALCASVAGYVGLPKGQPYSATKAAVINIAESLKAEVSKNIDVKLINPGFVETPLTKKNDFTMPMILSPERAAAYISKGLLSKKFEIHFPKGFTYMMKMLRMLPYGLLFLVTHIKSRK